MLTGRGEVLAGASVYGRMGEFDRQKLLVGCISLGLLVCTVGCVSESEPQDHGTSSLASEAAAVCTGAMNLPGLPLIPGALGSVTTADLNGDGKGDLIGTNGSISVRLGQGGGAFGPAVDYPAGSGAVAVVVADLNADGKPDLAAANYASANVSVLLNQGNGTFAAAVNYPVGKGSIALAAGDLNRDGRPDLAVVNYEDSTVSVLKNKGKGTFAAKVDYSFANNPTSVAVADFTGDGWPDLVLTSSYHYKGYITVHPNHLGTFKPFEDNIPLLEFDEPVDPRSVIGTDLSGDGKPDIAVANTHSGTVTVWVNKGRAKFDYGVDYKVGDSNVYVQSLAAADLTGDGKPELVTVNGFVNVLTNQGGGTFAASPVTYEGADYPVSVAAGEMTGDGKSDLVVAYSGTSGTSLFVNQGSGTFAAPTLYPMFDGSDASPVVADLTGDGKPEIIGRNGTSFRVRTNLGNGAFGPEIYYPVSGGSFFAGPMTAADFSGDGKNDLAYGIPGGVTVMLNRGDGTFSNFNYNAYSQFMVAADLTGDGKIDIALAAEPDSNVRDVVTVLVNKGDGTFAPPVVYQVGYNSPSGFAAADVTGDGKTDLILASYGMLSVMPNRGDGTFGAKVDYAVGNDHGPVVAADLTGDGKPDLATLRSDGIVSVVVNQGDGTFGPKVDYVLGSPVASLAAADLSGDGKLDLVVPGYQSGYARSRVSVLLNQGNGTFGAPIDYAAGYSPDSVVAADLTGDGRLDLLVAGGGFSVLPFAGCVP
ncbi:VCBS repeat-containing protein [Pendulispora brunnea]|uniref:VCBS repeat-containing protein n=1 Tax=Pendulispora brunnea TaxID=2905690 RepID=A0ABZ2JUX5_9BACT